jgi:hypothetical protein
MKPTKPRYDYTKALGAQPLTNREVVKAIIAECFV